MMPVGTTGRSAGEIDSRPLSRQAFPRRGRIRHKHRGFCAARSRPARCSWRSYRANSASRMFPPWRADNRSMSALPTSRDCPVDRCSTMSLEQGAVGGCAIDIGQADRPVRRDDQAAAIAAHEPREPPAIPGVQLLVAVDDHDRFGGPRPRIEQGSRQRRRAVVQPDADRLAPRANEFRLQGFEQRRFAATMRAHDRPPPMRREPRDDRRGIAAAIAIGGKQKRNGAGANAARRKGIRGQHQRGGDGVCDGNRDHRAQSANGGHGVTVWAKGTSPN